MSTTLLKTIAITTCASASLFILNAYTSAQEVPEEPVVPTEEIAPDIVTETPTEEAPITEPEPVVETEVPPDTEPPSPAVSAPVLETEVPTTTPLVETRAVAGEIPPISDAPLLPEEPPTPIETIHPQQESIMRCARGMWESAGYDDMGACMRAVRE